MGRTQSLQVKDVARMTGLSVRTLHHYDELGLLTPSGRSEAGYRLYDEHDLLRLQQILLGRELGLSLEEIRRSLDDPAFDRKRALREQRRQLEQRAQHTAAMLRAVDAALALLEEPPQPSGETIRIEQIFDGFEPAQYEAETKQRWADTDAYAESKKRTKRYTPEDWKRQAAEQAGIYADANGVRQSGKAADDEAAMDVAERHRLAIDRWFYPCSHAMQCKLADMYEQDPRFAANIDKAGAGLTEFLAAAIRANACRP